MRLKRVVIVLCVLMLTVSGCGKNEKNESIGKISEKSTSLNDNEKSEFTESIIENFEYEECDGGISIIGYTDSVDVINIPDEINGKKVVAIADEAFMNDSIKEANISNNVEKIGEKSFYMCSSLGKVELGNKIEKIGNFCFSNCTSLTQIKLPENLKILGGAVFASDENLENVVMDSKITLIDSSAFLGCGIKSVVIPDGVTSIMDSAFEDCLGLESITIPESVENIDENAFGNNTNITIKCSSGSYAENYAKEHNIPVELQ